MDYKKKDKVIPLFYPIPPIFFYHKKKYEGGKKTLTIKGFKVVIHTGI